MDPTPETQAMKQGKERPLVLAFGEMLWDVLPAGKFPGGAPFNVAYHLRHQDTEPFVVSAVGRDPDGEALLRLLEEWGISTDGIARHASLPTGTVRATLSPSGDAHYDIVEGVAWDRIVASPPVLKRAAQARAIVFGSLAQRSAANRETLAAILAALPASAERVFDVNFRPPFDDLVRIRHLASQATLLKLNAAEAARLAAGEPESPGREEVHARRLGESFPLADICITAGARGAGLLRHDTWIWEEGRPTQVADTVGAGDSFLASLLAHRLRGEDTRTSLSRACRLGEWVASCSGGTPSYETRRQ